MIDIPVDTLYLWTGLAVVGVAAVGVATSLPTAPPPDATTAAHTVDAVAASEPPTYGEQPTAADRLRVTGDRLELHGDGGSASAALAEGVVVVEPGSRLHAVATGTHPAHVFEDPGSFEAAVGAAADADPRWIDLDGTLRIRVVSWEGIDVTLVTN